MADNNHVGRRGHRDKLRQSFDAADNDGYQIIAHGISLSNWEWQGPTAAAGLRPAGTLHMLLLYTLPRPIQGVFRKHFLNDTGKDATKNPPVPDPYRGIGIQGRRRKAAVPGIMRNRKKTIQNY